MRYAVIALFLIACGSDEPSTNLAATYAYSLTLDQPAGVDCSGTGVLDFQADTLGVSTECFGSGGVRGVEHAVAPITNVVQDGASLTFDYAECAPSGTIAEDEINGTVACDAPSGGGFAVSGTWTATATE